MQEAWTLRVIAHIENDYVEKFGIPRQSGAGGADFAHRVCSGIPRRERLARGWRATAISGCYGGFMRIPRAPGRRWSSHPAWVGIRAWACLRRVLPTGRTRSACPRVRLMSIRPVSGKGQVLLVQGRRPHERHAGL